MSGDLTGLCLYMKYRLLWTSFTKVLKYVYENYIFFFVLGETRCLEERLIALKTSNESGIPVFVPVCREDGRYVEVQCHYGTGYCWCVSQDGKPVQGSSIRYDKPKCKHQGNKIMFFSTQPDIFFKKIISLQNKFTLKKYLLRFD